MAVRLVCGDGCQVRLSRHDVDKFPLLANNAQVSCQKVYRLRCQASSEVLSLLLDKVDDESATIGITKANFHEVVELCDELGFSGLDEELRAFSSKFGVKHEVEVLEKRFLEHELKLERFEDELRLLKSCVSKLEGLSLKVGSLEKDGGQLRDIFMKRDGIA